MIWRGLYCYVSPVGGDDVQGGMVMHRIVFMVILTFNDSDIFII